MTSTRALPLLLMAAAAAAVFFIARGSNRLETASIGNLDRTAPRRIAGGAYEASGLAAVPGDSQFLFVDDGEEREIFLLTLTDDGVQTEDAIALPFAADVTDMEGATTDGRFFYVVGSQSKRTGYDGDGLARFTFDPGTRRIERVERIQGLKAWLATHVAELRGTERLIGDEVLNIEGLAWDPRNRWLLLGLRAPVVGDSALVVPLKLSDTTVAFTASNLRVDGTTLRIPLGGAGIRGIEWDAVANAFLVIVGASLDHEDRDFRVVEWSGQSGSHAREIAAYDRRLKPEGIARGTPAGNRRVVVFDGGHLAVLRN